MDLNFNDIWILSLDVSGLEEAMIRSAYFHFISHTLNRLSYNHVYTNVRYPIFYLLIIRSNNKNTNIMINISHEQGMLSIKSDTL